MRKEEYKNPEAELIYFDETIKTYTIISEGTGDEAESDSFDDLFGK